MSPDGYVTETIHGSEVGAPITVSSAEEELVGEGGDSWKSWNAIA
jgi:hypothetical protein